MEVEDKAYDFLDEGYCPYEPNLINLVGVHAPFWKLGMKEFLGVMNKLSFCEAKIVLYIFSKMLAQNNQFSACGKEIESDLKCSHPTVVKSFQHLRECDFLRKVRQTQYMVNPRIVMIGAEPKAKYLIHEYGKLERG